MSSTAISIKPYSPLLRIPEALFLEIINKYSTSDDIIAIGKALLNVQKTNPSLYKEMKKVWITRIARLNLSVIASENIITKDNGKAFKIINLKTIFSTEKPRTFLNTEETTETQAGIKYLQNPRGYYNNQELPLIVKNSIFQTNRIFLTHFCKNSLRHLSTPETVLFLSTVFSQLNKQMISPLTSVGISIANLENEALDLIISSIKNDHSQLFYLLHEHRKWCSKLIDVKNTSLQNNHLLYQQFNNLLFFYAAQYRRTNVMKILLRASTIDQVIKATDVNLEFSPKVFPTNRIPLIISMSQGKTALKIAIENILSNKSTDLSIIETLLANGANANLKFHDEPSPLQTALCYENKGQDSIRIKIIKSLLDAKANIDGVNQFGETPLLYAIRFSSAKVFKFFLKQKPNIQLSTFTGDTALITAAQNPNCINKLRLLLTSRKLTLILNGKKSSQKFKCYKWINRTDFQGNTALMHAVRYQHFHIETYVKTLLNARADISLVNKAGETALKIAVDRSLPESVILLLTESPSHDNKGKKRRRDSIPEHVQNLDF